MTRRLPYRCVQRLQRLIRVVPITSTGLRQGWRLSLFVAAALWISALPACQVQSVHRKVMPYATAASAEKIDRNLLRLEADVRSGGKRLDTAAAEMGIKTVSGRLRLDIITQPLDASIVRKLQLSGVVVHDVSFRYQRVSVTIADPALIYDLAQIPEVRMILPDYGATTSHGAGHHSPQPGDRSYVRQR